MSETTIQMIVPALGWALLHIVWQGLIVGVVAGLVLALMRGAGPRGRYAVCALALGVSLALPLLNLAYLLDQTDDLSSVLNEAPSWQDDLQAFTPAIVTAWSLGVSLMTLRLAPLVTSNKIRFTIAGGGSTVAARSMKAIAPAASSASSAQDVQASRCSSTAAFSLAARVPSR